MIQVVRHSRTRGMAAMLETDLISQVNQSITLVGIARDAHAGAVVLLEDGTPVFIKGLASWDDNWNRKQIKITGVLRERKLAPDPEVNEKGEVSHGMEGDAWVLENATWVAQP